jgi:hypothetical protein
VQLICQFCDRQRFFAPFILVNQRDTYGRQTTDYLFASPPGLVNLHTVYRKSTFENQAKSAIWIHSLHRSGGVLIAHISAKGFSPAIAFTSAKNCRHGFEFTATLDCETFQLTGLFRSGPIVSPFHSGGRYEEVVTNERFLPIKLIQVETREFL